MRLALEHHPGGVDLSGPDTIVYDVSANIARSAPARVATDALSWTLLGSGGSPPAEALLVAGVDLDPQTEWLMRCDRVDFEPGGIAYRHTHPGPGIRCLLHGQITIDTQAQRETYAPGQAWFERGPDAVLATTSATEPSAFVRVMLLPVAFAGQRTIRYVDPADADKPKTQRATIFCEARVQRP